jgi:tetratricopeptide (TPR) repeat protein
MATDVEHIRLVVVSPGDVADERAVVETVVDGLNRTVAADQGCRPNAYSQGNRTEEAVAILEPLLPDRERVLGAEHPGALATRCNLAAAYLVAGRGDEAIEILKALQPDYERILGADHHEVVTTRKLLAAARPGAGQEHRRDSGTGTACDAARRSRPVEARADLRQALEQRDLAADDLRLRGLWVKPRDAVDLGERPQHAGARRPCHLERARAQVFGVKVALDRERDDALARLLADLPELDDRPARRRMAELLGELPARALQRVLARLELALGDRPGALVLA